MLNFIFQINIHGKLSEWSAGLIAVISPQFSAKRIYSSYENDDAGLSDEKG